jgi:hypothetical protein
MFEEIWGDKTETDFGEVARVSPFVGLDYQVSVSGRRCIDARIERRYISGESPLT